MASDKKKTRYEKYVQINGWFTRPVIASYKIKQLLIMQILFNCCSAELKSFDARGLRKLCKLAIYTNKHMNSKHSKSIFVSALWVTVFNCGINVLLFYRKV